MARDEPTTSTVPDADVVVINPQRSPHCEATTQFPLTSVGVEVAISDIDKEAGEEHHKEESLETDPIVTPPSTTALGTSSLASTLIRIHRIYNF